MTAKQSVYRIHTASGFHVVYVPAGRGELLRSHLRSLGIEALVAPLRHGMERLEVAGNVTALELQTILHYETS